MPLGLGLIGAGGFATFVAAAVADLPGVRLVAVADTDPGRAAVLAARHGAAAVPDAAALLARHAVEAVVIATPPGTHAGLALAALAAGRHVFCEKPLATTAADADAVHAAAAASGRTLVVDHVLRYNPLLRALVALRTRGLLPAVQRFAFDNDAADEDLPEGHWFWDEAHSGGILVEHGVHFFDAASMLIGSEPDRVQALGLRRPSGTLDSVVATAAHPGGVSATHAHGFTHAHRAERQLMRVDFGTAEARVHGWIPLRAELDVWTGEAGAARFAALHGRAAELFRLPGYRCSGAETVAVAVERDAGPARALGRGRAHEVPHRVRVRLTLGEDADKQRVYAESVRAAMADLVHGARTGDRPAADAGAGRAAVRTALAATRALRDGTTWRVADLGGDDHTGGTDGTGGAHRTGTPLPATSDKTTSKDATSTAAKPTG